MQKVAEFEKVDFSFFAQAMQDCLPEVDEQEYRHLYDVLELPERATSGSAGYDFHTPVRFTLKAGQSIRIPTGIRVRIEPGWWLGLLPRSGLGFKYRVGLDNTMGVIDSDYYYAENQGQIFVKLTNDSREGKTISLETGERLLQGIFIPYGITVSDRAEGTRTGGFGSTGQ